MTVDDALPPQDLTRLLDAANEDWWVHDPNTGTCHLSPRCWSLLGERADHEGSFEDWAGRFVDDDFRRALRALGQRDDDQGAGAIDVVARHADGRTVNLLLRGRAEDRNTAGQPQRVLGTLAEASEDRRSARQLESALRFQELVFATQNDLMFVKDASFRIVQANDAFLSVYPPEQRDSVIGTTTFEAYEEAQMREFVAEDQRALDVGYSEVEETIDFPDGGRRQLWTTKTRFIDANNDAFVLGVARDITDQKRIERELRRANEELQEFAYRVSHDLRAPLVSALRLVEHGYAAVERGDDALARRTLPTAIDSLQRLQRLADDLLDLARIRFGDRTPEAIDLEALVDATWARVCVDHPDVELGFETSFELLVAPVSDRRGLAVIIDNLLSNSLKYHDPAEFEPRVRVRARSDARTLVLEIEDNGLGVPVEHRDRLFDMFERLHPDRAHGSGLGLYMVRAWSERLGGHALAHHPDKGIRFSIELPHMQLA